MFEKLSQLSCIFIFLIGNGAYALQCTPLEAERVAANYDIIFVAFLSKGYFVEGEDAKGCGWIEGYFEVVDSIKGNPESVTVVRKNILNCNNVEIGGGASDSFPIGKYILVTTNNEIARIGYCTPVWDDYERYCIVDNIRRYLNIDAANAELREMCIKSEHSRGMRSSINTLRMDITELESERESINKEIVELKGKLSEAELNQAPE